MSRIVEARKQTHHGYKSYISRRLLLQVIEEKEALEAMQDAQGIRDSDESKTFTQPSEEIVGDTINLSQQQLSPETVRYRLAQRIAVQDERYARTIISGVPITYEWRKYGLRHGSGINKAIQRVKRDESIMAVLDHPIQPK